MRDAKRLACRKSLLGAEQNYYVQLYVEDTGKPGDLRISEVRTTHTAAVEKTAAFAWQKQKEFIADRQFCLQVRLGDPAAKGSIFVHERI